MKNLLKELNMTIRQFSEKYEIPYNTVRQWERGLNSPPKYVMNLLREKIDREKNGEQIKIQADMILYEYYDNNELKYRAHMYNENNTEEQIYWFNMCQNKYIQEFSKERKKKIYLCYEKSP